MERQKQGAVLLISSTVLPSIQHLGCFCKSKVKKRAYEGAVQDCVHIASGIEFFWGEIPALLQQTVGIQYY